MSAVISARERVLAVLAAATAPMTSGQMYKADDAFADLTQVSNACYQLRKQGKILAGPGGFWLAGKPAPQAPTPATSPPPKAAAKPAPPATPAPRPAVPARDVLAQPGGTSAPAGEPDDDHEARLEPFLRPAPVAVPAPPADFDAAIRLDGTLIISDGDATVELNAAQCARLLKFLEAHA